MSDLNAGSKVKGLDTPPTVQDSQSGTYSFTNTSYGVSVSSGTYADCGVVFIAPTTGRVIVKLAAFLRNSTAAQGANIAPVVRTGGTIGSGSTVLAAADATSVQMNGNGSNTDGGRTGVEVLVEGLTPGDEYNVRLEHRVTANTGLTTRRSVIVAPAT